MLGGGAACVTALHLVGRLARAGGRPLREALGTAGSLVGPSRSIPDKCAPIVTVPEGERIAVFREARRSARCPNLCAHQNGPIGEGRIIDGCVTCPWHGYQYRLEDGCAPAPFTERLATYRVRIATAALSRSIRARCRRARPPP